MPFSDFESTKRTGSSFALIAVFLYLHTDWLSGFWPGLHLQMRALGVSARHPLSIAGTLGGPNRTRRTFPRVLRNSHGLGKKFHVSFLVDALCNDVSQAHLG